MKTKETNTPEQESYVDLFAKDYEFLKSYVTVLARSIETIKTINNDIEELIHASHEGSRSSREISAELHEKQESLALVEQEYNEICAMVDKIFENKKIRLNEIKQIMRGDANE
ncbi:MAG: hypothetical protein J6C90_01260 [Clostridia bacterium]|nr:hypothetical protein [Clostridia bacterium]